MGVNLNIIPHPDPLPQGERGDGGKKILTAPLTLALSHKGRGKIEGKIEGKDFSGISCFDSFP